MKWFEGLLKWYERLFVLLLKTVCLICVLVWAWVFPIERIRANIALEVQNASLSVPREFTYKEFGKDIKNGGTVVLVGYADEPGREYFYRFFEGELKFEEVRDIGAPKPLEGVS